MLEKPNLPDEQIISHLQEQFELQVTELTFLPLGADMGTAVYRVTVKDGKVYFLKLRKGFEEIIVRVPLFLKSQGIREIISPFETKSKKYWVDFGSYKMILYPFFAGENSYEMELPDHHKRRLGRALKAIHSIQIPADLKERIPEEAFSAQWREQVKSFQALVEEKSFRDPTAAKLARFMKSKRDEIQDLLARAGQLATELQSKPLELVLCHTDIHRANMLVTEDDDFYIVDWDNPLLAPKERDLMFIGGGVDNVWKNERDAAIFYEGYGNTDLDFAALAYYRYERIIEDLAAYGEQLLMTDEGGADREPGFRRFVSNFEPGSTIEIAEKTDKL